MAGGSKMNVEGIERVDIVLKNSFCRRDFCSVHACFLKKKVVFVCIHELAMKIIQYTFLYVLLSCVVGST